LLGRILQLCWNRVPVECTNTWSNRIPDNTRTNGTDTQPNGEPNSKPDSRPDSYSNGCTNSTAHRIADCNPDRNSYWRSNEHADSTTNKRTFINPDSKSDS
jgi:hypothetical protein